MTVNLCDYSHQCCRNIASIIYFEIHQHYHCEGTCLEADVLNIHIVTIFQEYCILFLCKIIFLRRSSNISRCRSGVAGSMISAISLCNFIYPNSMYNAYTHASVISPLIYISPLSTFYPQSVSKNRKCSRF